MKTLAQEIKKAIQKNNIKNVDIAKLLQVKPAQVSNWIHEKSGISEEQVTKLALFLKEDVEKWQILAVLEKLKYKHPIGVKNILNEKPIKYNTKTNNLLFVPLDKLPVSENVVKFYTNAPNNYPLNATIITCEKTHNIVTGWYCLANTNNFWQIIPFNENLKNLTFYKITDAK